MMRRNKPILLIEADPVNTNNIKGTIEEMGVKSPFVHSDNNEEALNYLRDQNNTKPWLILFAPNSHGPDGLNFLQTIKTDNDLKIIPVVILAESNKDHMIAEGFELGIAGYIVKPRDSSKITDTIRTIMDYWFLSELPPAKV